MFKSVIEEAKAIKQESEVSLTQKLKRNEQISKELTTGLITELNTEVMQIHSNQ